MSSGKARLVAFAMAWTLGSVRAQHDSPSPAELDQIRLAALDAEVFDARSFVSLVESGLRVAPELIAMAVDQTETGASGTRRRARALRALRLIGPN